MLSLPSGHRDPQGEAADYFDTAIIDELAALTGALTVFYVVVSIAHWLLLPRHAAIVMTPLAAVSACILFATYLAHRKRHFVTRRLHPLAFFVFTVALTNCVTHLYLLGRPEDTTNLALLITATGWLTLSRSWFAIAAA